MLSRLRLARSQGTIRNVSSRFQQKFELIQGESGEEGVNENLDKVTTFSHGLPCTSLLSYSETIHDVTVQISKDVHANFGPNCSESLYQRAVLRALYLQNIPVMAERDIFTDYGQGPFLVGRVDLEIAGCCLYEFKSGKINIAEHSNQLKRYLRAYENNNESMRVAVLLYFTNTGVFVHRVL